MGDTPQKPTASEPAPRPAELTPTAASTEPEPAEPDLAVAASDLPRFDLSVHAVAALVGVTTVDVAGYAPKQGQQSHRAIGLRLAAAPRGAWWSAEVGISGERLDTPTVHVRDHEDMEQEERRMNGSWLRADVGMRVRSGKNWMPTAHVGLGLQAHLRSIEKSLLRENAPPESLHSEERMLCRAVLVLGMGLQYKDRNVLLGIDFQMRQGVPTDYRSVATTLSVGVFLDQGE